MSESKKIDLPALINQQPISGTQMLIVGLCSLVALLDGLDTQSIGVAAPFIAKLFGLEKPQLGPIFSAGLIGAALGALTFGPLADQFGRKR
ncbi:MAG: aromatic acid/H+ symport family MFS transporter, partial [Burkholderiales bacterium]|nr:aromatic acid/H+ symport family MFS transporter [Burkholderiales bacterium]